MRDENTSACNFPKHLYSESIMHTKNTDFPSFYDHWTRGIERPKTYWEGKSKGKDWKENE